MTDRRATNDGRASIALPLSSIGEQAVDANPSGAMEIGDNLRPRRKAVAPGRLPDAVSMHRPAWISQRLDDANQRLASGAISTGMGQLAEMLLDCRDRMNAAEWRMIAAGVCRKHAILATLLLDPFTARSFYKPRGYPGDAVLLDLIYAAGQRDRLLSEATETGRLIYQYSSDRCAPNAVRWRCQHIAQRIDELSQHRRPLRVLSIASGHARELRHSLAAHRGGITEFVALDADRQTLEVAARESNGVPIITVEANVKMLLRACQNLGAFDLVYSLGLFDYLAEKTASRVIATIAKLLRPGGHAMVANFSPDLPDAGYMEAFMDWWLVYRDEHDLRQLCQKAGVAGCETYSDPSRCLAVLTWARPS